MKKMFIIILACLSAAAIAAISERVNTVGLVAHYKLWAGFTTAPIANVSDGTVFDYSLNGNEGVIDANDAVTLPAYPGFSFDGADSKITVPADPSIDANGKTALTISVWINPASDGEGGFGRILDKFDVAGTPTAGYAFFLESEAASKVIIRVLLIHAGFSNDVRSGVVVPINTLSHVAYVYNEDGGKEGKLYLNGEILTLSIDQDGTGDVQDDSAVDLTIGNATAISRTFDGLIDNVMIFNTAKSAAEIKSIYEVTRGRYSR